MDAQSDNEEMGVPRYRVNPPRNSRRKRSREDESPARPLRRQRTDKESSEYMKSKRTIRKPKTRSTTSGTHHRDREQDSSVLVNPNMAGSSMVNRNIQADSESIEFLLDPGLIEFGLKMQLQNSPLVDQIHVFSTLFFRKLDAGRGKRCDYEAVKKWTSKCDIFSKKFIIVPINEDFCWYIAIICFPGLIFERPLSPSSRSSNATAEKTSILILDPRERPHLRTVRILREYLRDEGKKRHGEVVDTFNSDLVGAQHLLMPVVSSYDVCGVYLLHYVEMFFANPLEIMALGPDARKKRNKRGSRYDELWRTDQVKDSWIDVQTKLLDLSIEWSAFNYPCSKNAPARWGTRDFQEPQALASEI
ncbi:Ulp1 protease family, carboxy-terminal catalytic domain protein [Rhizoctonia solani AG-3 Rhs1AP]|uniref:Ulp1 protease family, carboxy-terminal catalytic domain protein n=1 Tax=Rhizoctonia solani AG-3 Rhs1AP TaxID=1086054 RepID=X8JIW1_9AGAM|nr:Ulp1 protease family, carboxy-terminal catalytic domain protein [Rhizoctonia solani AG-3 Rhs1AP]